MDKYTLMEESFKNGYSKGLKDGSKTDRNGTWRKVRAGNFYGMECSFCHEKVWMTVYRESRMNFCSNCGAKMEEERRGGEEWQKEGDLDA